MSDHHQETDLTNEDIQYEKTDLKISWLISAAAAIFLVTLGAMFLIMTLIGGLDTRREALSPTALPLVDVRPTPPPPRLQPNPIDRTTAEEQMVEMYEENAEILTTYQWVDEEAGIARIPIDDAILILAPDDSEPPR